MRLAKFQRYLADLEDATAREEWDEGLGSVRRIEAAIQAGYLSGGQSDARVARDAIYKSLKSAVDAHQAASRAADELALRQETSTSTRQLIEELDQDILGHASFIEKEAYGDEKNHLSQQLDRLISQRNEVVDDLEKVESDWPELRELERMARIQSEVSLSLIEDLLEEVERIHSGADDASREL